MFLMGICVWDGVVLGWLRGDWRRFRVEVINGVDVSDRLVRGGRWQGSRRNEKTGLVTDIGLKEIISWFNMEWIVSTLKSGIEYFNYS